MILQIASKHSVSVRVTSRAGFTMWEALYTFAIIGIITLIALGSYSTYKRRTNMNSVVQELTGNLERARTLSLVQLDELSYGIHFATGQYVLFSGSTYNPSAPDNDVKSLGQFHIIDPIVFSDGTGGLTTDIVFQALSGATTNDGTVRIEAVGDATLYRDITVNSLGIVTNN